jgi:hypothetical protein
MRRPCLSKSNISSPSTIASLLGLVLRASIACDRMVCMDIGVDAICRAPISDNCFLARGGNFTLATCYFECDANYMESKIISTRISGDGKSVAMHKNCTPLGRGCWLYSTSESTAPCLSSTLPNCAYRPGRSPQFSYFVPGDLVDLSAVVVRPRSRRWCSSIDGSREFIGDVG